MKKSLLMFIPLILTISACNSASKNDETSKNKLSIKTNESVELLSQDSYPIPDGTLKEVTPTFKDGHIDYFGAPIYQTEMIQKVNDGYLEINISLKPLVNGSLYFNLNSDATGTYKDALRVELYQQASNTSVIYSYEGGESISTGTADLNGDGQIDKDSFSGEEIKYTNGQASYHTEKFNSKYIDVTENESIEIHAYTYIDGFTLNNEAHTSNFKQLEFIFEVK